MAFTVTRIAGLTDVQRYSYAQSAAAEASTLLAAPPTTAQWIITNFVASGNVDGTLSIQDSDGTISGVLTVGVSGFQLRGSVRNPVLIGKKGSAITLVGTAALYKGYFTAITVSGF